MVNPYSEARLGKNQFLRVFRHDVPDDELKWHQDWEDRNVEFLNENDWKIQIDNELPQRCHGMFFIKAKVWHRLIKGTNNLEVKITKHPESGDI